MATVHKFLFNHGIASFIFISWSMGIVSYATHQVFKNPELINASTAAAYSALLAIPPAAISFFKWRAEKLKD